MGRIRKQHQEIQESKSMMKTMKLLLLVLEKLQQKEEVVNFKERGQEIFRREKKYSRNCKALTWILCLNPRANYITSSFSVLQKQIGNHWELIVVHDINLYLCVCVCVCVCVCARARARAQLYLTLWNPRDCSLPGSSLHGIFQARILEQVAISYW